MHQGLSSGPETAVGAALRRAAVRAVRAPSVHNSQPWRLVIGPGALTVVPDRSRHLRVFDPMGRQLLISCGCAATNAQVSMAADGIAAGLHIEQAAGSWPTVRVQPQDDRPDEGLAALDRVVEARSTPRSPITRQAMSDELTDRLRDVAADAGVEFGVVTDEKDRGAVERMGELGTRILCTYPEYLTELRAWTTGPARADGLPPTAVPLLSGTAGAAAEPGMDEPCDVIWFATPRDDTASWVQVGSVLERALLELTAADLAAVPLAQVVEVPTQRAAFSTLVGTGAWPQVILRVGKAPAPVQTRRRRLADVIA
jgi:hypothetical protein